MNNILHRSLMGISSEFFTIESLEEGLTTVSLPQNALKYRISGGAWTLLPAGETTISINKGQTLSFKGNLTPNSNSGIGTFTVDKAFNVEGNIMSLLYGDDFIRQIDLSGKEYAFYKLFADCTTLQNAENLILPATKLANSCYYEMFQGCTSLTTAPALPATKLANSCYYEMFQGCTSLTTAPELPATTLADNCYSNMFVVCTSLTTAPELPATELASQCYYGMFDSCTSLTTAPELPATTLAEGCYYYMFQDCTSLTTAPELKATTLVNDCYYYMFNNCSNLTTAPELPATTLAEGCYSYMFYNCSKLKYIKMLATDISAYYCLSNWVSGVSYTGIFVKHPDMTLPRGESGIPEPWLVRDCDSFEYYDYSKEYFTIKALEEDGLTVKLSLNTSQYRIDDGSWDTLPAGETISINKGQKLSFRITNPTISSSYGIGTFTVNKEFNVEGNIMSLLYGYDFEGQADLSEKDNVFYKLFADCTTLQNAENLILPATTLANSCYSEMFQGCTSLKTIPYLISRSMSGGNCYRGMFRGCTSLTTVEILPAEVINYHCYYSMFENCTSLINPPIILLNRLINENHDDTRAYNCRYMFKGCTSLTTAPELPATTLANSCYYGIFEGCTSLTEVPALPATTLANNCYFEMFKGCTSLTTAPAILSTTLSEGCYSYMFYGCTSLTTAPELKVEKLAEDCYDSMFRDCTSLITAPALRSTTLAGGCYSNMFLGCTSLTTAPELPATTLAGAGGCYSSMFQGCTSLTSAPALPATTLIHDCYDSMFKGCTSLTAAPTLSAKKLEAGCYKQMFYNCSNLSVIRMYATNIDALQCLFEWVKGVKQDNGFFHKNSITSLTPGESGIPIYWHVIDENL